MFRHILLPTDGSPLSMRAARMAVELARAHRARITAYHAIALFRPVVDMDLAMPYAELYSPQEYKRTTEKAAKALLERVARTARAKKVRCDIAFGSSDAPWKAIVKEARKRRCDLIVMASHGRRGLEGVILGSETTRVLTHSKTPVLVTR
jgi:nucleotide-binding universal stress UspA family protein